MIRYAELRDRVQSWPKYEGCQRLPRAPLVTSAFPGAFNMSFTEHHWIAELGGYLDWDHDFVFSTVQTCVRLGDFDRLASEDGALYLGAFELADLGGAIALQSRPDYGALQRWQVAQLVALLDELGIGPERIHASYSAGGRVADMTAGRYHFEQQIPPDDLSRDALLEAGVPETNLTTDATRATLLALHVHRPTPWGYRSELHVEVEAPSGRQLVEVASLEYFLWRPRFRDGRHHRAEIVGLAPLETGAAVLGIGLERLAMVANGLRRIQEVDYLQPFYDALETILGRPLRPADYLTGESLRALHRIYADLAVSPEPGLDGQRRGLADLSFRRRKKLGALKRSIPARLGVPELERLLVVHTRHQPWHENLEAGVEPATQAILAYRKSPARSLVSP
jgi:hypothetical protein